MIIMKKLSESIWRNISQRSEGIKSRKEDKIGNINSLKPVDVGTDVLWADRDLEIEGSPYILFDDINNLLQNSQWRLPTIKDIDNLHRYCTHKEYDDYFLECGKNDLRFDKKGMIYNTSVSHGYENVIEENAYWGWTSEESSGSTIHCFIIDGDDVLYTHLNKHFNFHNVVNADRTSKLCVRLIKDK